jgi:hypothetical protein
MLVVERRMGERCWLKQIRHYEPPVNRVQGTEYSGRGLAKVAD